jgi:hypothetical protein
MNKEQSVMRGIVALAAIILLGPTMMVVTTPREAFAPFSLRDASPAITGDKVYVAWWTNNTANKNEEVMFRASTDGGKTFGDKINLSNTTNSDSSKVQIRANGDRVVVTWWETNQTKDTPVMRVSDNNGDTFGPLLKLAANGTIGEG